MDPRAGQPATPWHRLWPATVAVCAAILGLHLLQAAVAVQQGWQDLGPALWDERDPVTRIALGGQYAPLLWRGEWGRLASSVWVHVDVLHALTNALAVAVLGRWLEPGLGAARWIAVLALGGVGGSWLSHVSGVAVSDGASGAAFAGLGLAAVWAARGWVQAGPRPSVSIACSPAPQPVDRSLVVALWGLLSLNVLLGLWVEVIDVAAHVGGGVVGLILGLVFRPGTATAAWWVVGACMLAATVQVWLG